MSGEGGSLTTDALVDEALALGEDLGRPLRYVQLNSFYNGSTGSIMRRLHSQLQGRGVDSYIFWGRRHETISDHERCCATRLGYLSHGAGTRLFDRMGFYSKRDTARLLERLDRIDPDVVHLHNVHGYYVNVEMLFGWLAGHRCQVRWTLHDCWAFTGHCAHFTAVGCDRWRGGTCGEGCPQLGTYPKTISKAGCARNFRDKLRAFTSVPPGRMTLIAPSRWLADLVGESFLAGYPVEVRHNTIDATVFRPTPSDFRERHGIGDRFMILGVASPWTERKGLGDFIRLTEELDADGFAIVLVGLSERQIRYLQKQLAALPRTQHERGIARTYTAADILARLAVGGVCGSATSGIRSCGVHVAVTEAPPCAEISDRMNAAVVLPDWSALKAAVVKLAGGGLVILAARTESKEQLAAIYTAADAFFNPTLEDNFPTVNLEAEACGTPVITYNTGGCAETIHLPVSRAIDGWQGCPIQG